MLTPWHWLAGVCQRFTDRHRYAYLPNTLRLRSLLMPCPVFCDEMIMTCSLLPFGHRYVIFTGWAKSRKFGLLGGQWRPLGGYLPMKLTCYPRHWVAGGYDSLNLTFFIRKRYSIAPCTDTQNILRLFRFLCAHSQRKLPVPLTPSHWFAWQYLAGSTEHREFPTFHAVKNAALKYRSETDHVTGQVKGHICDELSSVSLPVKTVKRKQPIEDKDHVCGTYRYFHKHLVTVSSQVVQGHEAKSWNCESLIWAARYMFLDQFSRTQKKSFNTFWTAQIGQKSKSK